MQITTKHLGNVEFSENDIIRFEEGIPSFESEKAFILIPSGSQDLPFHYLQSVGNADVAFIVSDPFVFVENYDFDLPEEAVKSLKIKNVADIYILSIATVPEKIENTTLNLAAPVVVNHVERVGKQIILQGDYAVKHYIFKDSGRGENA
ncbi:MAG: flagellar assembly factor FliW [Clostridiales bacterium]|jgi:flagellar assembly factor FliW|nr:flagellar assembly factor FliW [Clostridiales bacterium]